MNGESIVDGQSLDLTRAEFRDLADGADGPVVVHVAAQLDADVAPLTAYAALADRSDHAFLLESAEKVASSDPAGAFNPTDASADRHARYSFVGYDPEAVISVHPDHTEVEELGPAAAHVAEGVDAADDADDSDVLDRLRGALPDVERRGFPDADRRRLTGGLVGFLAYDAVYDLWLKEVGVERPDPVVPDAQFVLTTRTLTFDQEEGTLSLAFTPILAPEDDPDAVYDDLAAEAADVGSTLAAAEPPNSGGFVRAGGAAGDRESYEEAVRRTKEHVLDGDIYQGVVSRTREAYGEVDPLGLYESLREVNPSPYMYLLQFDERTVVGASPETLISVRGRHVTSNPIAGTCPRGDGPVEDRRLAGEMLADEKERAEHTMLVDLARNDVRRVAEPGSVRVEEFMNVLKYSHVQHIESTVTGTLATDGDDVEGAMAGQRARSVDAFDATRATFPAGTLTGAPKVRAMELVDDMETEPRGVYGGGVGYYSWSGDADFAIVIRTATVEAGAGPGGTDVVRVRAGAGLVADSDPASEFEETEQKMDGVLTALRAIERDRESDDGDSAGGDADATKANDDPDARGSAEVTR